MQNNNTINLPAAVDAARESLLQAMAAVSVAQSTAGQPGGLSNLVAAEAASGCFIAKHGKGVLDLMLARQGLGPSELYIPASA